MKILLMAALVICMVYPAGKNAAGQPSAERPGVEEIKCLFILKDGVNIHKSPGFGTGVVAKVDSGEICRYAYEIGEWILVDFADERYGFVHSSMAAPYIIRTEPEEESPVTFETGDGSYMKGVVSAVRTDSDSQKSTGFWRWIAFASIAVNLILLFTLFKKWLAERERVENYDEMRELAKLEESKETLKRELFLTTRQNRRLEEQVIRLKRQIDNKS